MRAGRPFWGSCLGAQLLAAALGARVYAGPAPEVGVLAVELTDAGRADPVLGALPASIDTLQWHGDTFDLPDGGVLLASSPAYPNQAFRVGRSAYAVQFHIEVTEAMGEEWADVPAYAEYADRVLGPGGSDRLLASFASARRSCSNTPAPRSSAGAISRKRPKVRTGSRVAGVRGSRIAWQTYSDPGLAQEAE